MLEYQTVLGSMIVMIWENGSMSVVFCEKRRHDYHALWKSDWATEFSVMQKQVCKHVRMHRTRYGQIK